MKKKSSILVNTLVLFVVTFIAVAALAVVNQITKGPIEQAEINARAEAYKIVYPDAQSFAEVADTEKLLEESAQMLSDAGFDGCSVNDVLAVTDSSSATVGYVISATSPKGYGGDIQVAVGISSKDSKLTGFAVLTSNETAGLGSKCSDAEFTSQFAGKPAATLTAKAGASADNEIDAVSGATISSKAVTEAANAAIIFYQSNFGGGVEAAAPYTIDSAEETADGYKIVVTTNKGFAGDIQLAIEIDKKETITAFEVLSSNETPGYGAACTEEDYAKQFVGLKADAVTMVDSDAKAENNEVDAISGATFTTKAIDIAVNGAIMHYQETFGNGVSDSLKEKNENADAQVDAVAGASVQKGE